MRLNTLPRSEEVEQFYACFRWDVAAFDVMSLNLCSFPYSLGLTRADIHLMQNP